MRKIRGILTPHNKNTAGLVPETITVPPEVRLGLSMHGGAPAIPIVAKGDAVRVGQLIAQADGKISSPVHASVSGTVKNIDEYDSVTGEKNEKTGSIVLTSDGEQTLFEGITPPTVTNIEEFLTAVRDSGVVGLGGAGYPTAHKLTLREGTKLDYILVNGAECEPYITSDTRTMIDEAAHVFRGCELLKKYLGPQNIVICIESNKPEAIERLEKLSADTDGVEVRVLPSRYPQGERKVLVYNVTGRIVPEGGRLTDVGCIVINCTTVAVLAKYIETGMPLTHRIVTVDGSAVRTPKNVVAPLGTPIRALFEHCGGLTEDATKIIMGGPMMGMATPSLDTPTVKVTGSVMALNAKDSKGLEATPCIKCARCIHQCPIKLLPSYIELAYELKDVGALNRYKVNMCLECGCCAYVCPARRPLSHVMVLAKNMQWEARQK